MCGLVGILDIKANRTINQSVLVCMRDALVHRGPDEAGIFTNPGIGLGHRRLSIIDISSGHQPMTSDIQPVTIVFNGEIYNFKEIRKILTDKGYSFSTHSDTEVILHAYEEWGEQCVNHLRGMFAFAIWDETKQKLFLARDRLGIKPLLYAITDDGYLVFGSEHKALLHFPGISRDINKQSIEAYFALGYIPEPNSIYTSINKLPAGHTLSIENQRVGTPRQYWDLPFGPTIDIDEEKAIGELIARIKEAIDIRLVAEVPLGAFLSGGVDSSAVVALMSSLQEEPVNTCSIGFDEKDYDESQYAHLVAEKYQTNHYSETVTSDDFDIIDELVNIYDEPFADSSALPTYRVCEIARKKVTVALSGDGADELMSGYRRHQFHLREQAVRDAIPASLRSLLFIPLSKLYPKADWAPQFLRAKSTFQSLAKDEVSAYFHSVSQNSDEIRNKLFSNEFKSQLNGYSALEIFRQHASNAPAKDPQSLIQYIDAKTYLIDDILTKVDRASMAHSLEVRVPLLDHKWVEWITAVNTKFKFDGKQGKVLLKKSMEPFLSTDILYRKKKGFSVPLAQWFRGPLRERTREVLTGDRLQNTGWFNQNYLETVWQEHDRSLKDHSTLIWSLLIFDSFLRKEDQCQS